MTRTTPPRPLDIEAVFPELSAHRATSTRLHPRPGTPAAHESSIGGPFLWPADEPWPVCREPHPRDGGRRVADVYRERTVLREAWTRNPGVGPADEDRVLLATLREDHHVPDRTDVTPIPLLPLAQLFTRDVPGLVAPEGADLVQVLWCPFDGHGPQGAPGVHVRWRSSSECQEILTAPPLPEVVGFGGYLPEPCVIAPEQVVEHEYVEHLDSDLRERIEAWETQLEEETEEETGEETGDDEEEAEEEAEGAILTYHHDLSVAAGWKVGGYAKWNVTGPACATCSCGSSMRLFLTVATSEWDGIISSWTPLEDRQTPSPQDIKHPTEVVVGRGGSLNIFTCAADPRHEHSVFLQ